jgi:hypothetical protein
MLCRTVNAAPFVARQLLPNGRIWRDHDAQTRVVAPATIKRASYCAPHIGTSGTIAGQTFEPTPLPCAKSEV